MNPGLSQLPRHVHKSSARPSRLLRVRPQRQHGSRSLGVSRQTVSNRLRAVEGRIGLSLLACATDLELALRLADHGLI
jgi:hypothetical protein